jgi:ATPase
MRVDILVPDSSVIIDGMVSEKIKAKEIEPEKIVIHEAILTVLESQANENRGMGFLGLDEITKLREMQANFGFVLEFHGQRPRDFEMKHGEIDSMIRALAYDLSATLMTADKVQAHVAEAKGIKLIRIKMEQKTKVLELEHFFDETTMSVHLRENVAPKAKKGRPGSWDYIQLQKEVLTRDNVIKIANEIIEEANIRKDGFIEIEREGSTIIQLGKFRIVITRPPFADGWEITAVRPVKKLDLDDYKMESKVLERVGEKAEGILIAGAPGHGKSTFAQALAEFYAKKNKVVKTVEAPRDLILPDEITQYAISHGTSQEMHDVLLLSRPDFTIFDEMRNTSDFELFADLRLSGVGMVGVVHATNPVDAIQRFVGRIELGVIPQIIDTVLFIRNGAIEKVLSLKIMVKVPSGMTDDDLARPVVVVHDFVTDKEEYELYTFGEETVVLPITEKAERSAKDELAEGHIKDYFKKYSDKVKVEVISDNKCKVFVPEDMKARIIGKQGSHIQEIEKKLGIHIDVETLSAEQEAADYEAEISKKNIVFYLPESFANRNVDIIHGGDYVLTAAVGKDSTIKIKKANKIGKVLMDAVNSREKIDFVVK